MNMVTSLHKFSHIHEHLVKHTNILTLTYSYMNRLTHESHTDRVTYIYTSLT